MHPRFAQLTLLVILGFFLALLIPALGPAIKELSERPSDAFVAAPRTPQSGTAASAVDFKAVARKADLIRKLNLKDARARTKAIADFARDRSTLKKLDAQIKTIQAKQPQTPRAPLDDVVSIEELDRGIPRATKQQYLESATRVKTFLLTAAYQSDDSAVFGEVKQLYDSAADTRDKELILQALESGIGNVEWQAKPGYRAVGEWLKRLIQDRGLADSVRGAAISAFVARPFVVPADLPFAIQLFRSDDPLLTLGNRINLIQNTYAFFPDEKNPADYRQGFEFLKELSKSSDPIMQGAAVTQLNRQAHELNGDQRLREAVIAFFNADPKLKQFASRYAVKAGSDERGLQTLTAAAKNGERSPYFAQAGPGPSCEPVYTPGQEIGHPDPYGGDTSTLRFFETHMFGWLPGATESDYVFHPDPAVFNLYLSLGEYHRPITQPYKVEVWMENTTAWNGTSGNTPQFNAVKQPDLCFQIPKGPEGDCWRGIFPSYGKDPSTTPSNERDPQGRRRPKSSPTPTPDPVCGNGIPESPPEECGEPGLQCPLYSPFICEACRCVIPEPNPPALPFAPPLGIPIARAQTAPGGSGSECLQKVSFTLPADPPTYIQEWSPTEPPPGVHGETYNPWLSCALNVASRDGAASTKIYMKAAPIGDSKQANKPILLPWDQDGDGLPDLYEAGLPGLPETAAQTMNLQTGRRERYNACRADTFGEPDGKRDKEVDRKYWEGASAIERQTAVGDGFTEWENYRGFGVKQDGLLYRSPGGSVVHFVKKAYEMEFEPGTPAGRRNVTPGVKKTFVKDSTGLKIVQSMLPGNFIANSFFREFGVQMIEPLYTDPRENSRQVTVDEGFRIGGVLGAINFNSAADPGAVARGFVRGPHSGVLFRSATDVEVGRQGSGVLARVYIRRSSPSRPVNAAIDDWYNEPPGEAVGLPVISYDATFPQYYSELASHIAGFNQAGNLHQTAMHEFDHKYAQALHSEAPRENLPAFLSYDSLPAFVETIEGIADSAFFVVEKPIIPFVLNKYFIGTRVKAEAFEPLQGHYEIPMDRTLENVKMYEKFAYTLTIPDNYEIFVPTAYRNRDDIRVPLFVILPFYRGLPLGEVEARQRAAANVISRFLSSALEFSRGSRGGHFIDRHFGSVIQSETVIGDPENYPKIDPARRFTP